MRIDQVKLMGRYEIDLPIIGVNASSRFLLKNADGLGPPEVDVYISDRVDSGGDYQGRRPRNREPVFRIGLNPLFSANETPADLRTEIYGLLQPNSLGQVVVQLLYQGQIVALTQGWVKKLETVPFSKEPEVQITLACNDPYLTAPNSIDEWLGNTVGTGVNNPGTVEVGVKMSIQWELDWDWFQIGKTFDFGSPDAIFQVGSNIAPLQWETDDILTIDTRAGSKSVTRNRGGVITNMLPYLTTQSKWFTMQPGDTDILTGLNVLYFYPGAGWHPVSMEITPKFWGV